MQTFKSVRILFCTVMIFTSLSRYASAQTSKANGDEKVIYRGNPSSPISSSVTVPANMKYFYSSGTLGPVADSTAATGTRKRFGDTNIQARGILEKLKNDLTKEGLGLNNVVFMRVYVAPDTENGKPDFKGWFDAYAEYFGTAENPVKPARSTIGVAQLVSPDRFIEIEIVAVY